MQKGSCDDRALPKLLLVTVLLASNKSNLGEQGHSVSEGGLLALSLSWRLTKECKPGGEFGIPTISHVRLLWM